MTATTTLDNPAPTPTRRDFLYLATGAVGGVGVAAAIWPLINQMSPDATTLAAASTEVDISGIARRPDPDRQMARQADLHFTSHAGGNQGGARGAP